VLETLENQDLTKGRDREPVTLLVELQQLQSSVLLVTRLTQLWLFLLGELVYEAGNVDAFMQLALEDFAVGPLTN